MHSKFLHKRKITRNPIELDLYYFIVQATNEPRFSNEYTIENSKVLQLMKKGKKSYYTQKYDLALMYYKQACRLDKNPIILNNLGCAILQHGNYKKALEYFFNIIAANESNKYYAYFNIGLGYHLQGLLDKALSAYQKAANDESIIAEVYYQLGSIYLEQQNFKAAQECFNIALKNHTNTQYANIQQTALVNLSTILCHLEEYDEAINLLEPYLDDSTDEDDDKYFDKIKFAIRYLNNLGCAYLAKGNSLSAIEYYTASLEISLASIYDEIYYNLGAAWVCHTKSSMKKTISLTMQHIPAEYSSMLHSSDNVRHKRNKMNMLFALLRLDEKAQKSFFTILEELPNDCKQIQNYLEHRPEAFSNLSEIYNNLGVLSIMEENISFDLEKLANCLLYFKKASELQPESPHISNNLACVLEELKQPQQAE